MKWTWKLLHLVVLLSVLAGVPAPGVAVATQSGPAGAEMTGRAPTAAESPTPLASPTVALPARAATAVASATAAHAPTISPSTTRTAVLSASPTPTGTATTAATGSPTPTRTLTATGTPTASPTITGTVTPTATPTPSATATITTTLGGARTTTIDPERGGLLQTEDGRLRLTFPPRSVLTTTLVTLVEETAPTDRRSFTLRQFRLTATEQSSGRAVPHFAQPVALSYVYRAQDAAPLGRERTHLTFLTREPGGSWSSLDGTLELKWQTVRASTRAPGLFAVGADPTLGGYLDETDVEPGRGGQLTSRDGRVRLDIPPGAVTERTRITYRPQRTPEGTSSSRSAVLAFELLGVNEADAWVEHFQRPLTVTVSFAPAAVAHLNPSTLHLRYFDATRSTWVAIPGTVDVGRGTAVVTVDHFTEFNLSGNPYYVVPPLQDSAQVDLYTGTTTWQLPLEVPPGPAGFQPHLTLSYSSASVNEMKSESSQPSWVGLGFNLTPGYIYRDWEKQTYFLVLGGVSDRLVKTGSDAEGDIYRTEHESYLKIRYHGGDVLSQQGYHIQVTGYFEVWSPDGTYHRFGYTRDQFGGGGGVVTHGSRHFYTAWNDWGDGYWGYQERDYRWDLDLQRDTDGNSSTLQYVVIDGAWSTDSCHHPGSGWCDNETGTARYSMAAYPSLISYSGNDAGGARRSVEFQISAIADTVDPRPDVRERRKLDAVRMKVDGAVVRAYDFDYDANGDEGEKRTLRQIRFHGTSEQWLMPNDGPLYSFGYGNGQFHFNDPYGESGPTFARAFLRTVSGFQGGSITYANVEDPSPPMYDWRVGWSRQIVQSRTLDDGMGQQAVYRYAYSGLTEEYARPDNAGWRQGEFRGYNLVTVTDPAGGVAHYRFFQGQVGINPENQTVVQNRFEDGALAGNAAQLQGKLYESDQHAADGTLLARTRNLYAVDVLHATPRVSFVRLTETVQLDNGREKGTSYTYDGYGNVSSAAEYDRTLSTTDPVRVTVTGHNPNPSAWIVDRPCVQVLYAGAVSQGQVAWAEGYYYDDAAVPANADACSATPPSKGHRTTLQGSPGVELFFTRYRYDSYGNRTQVIDPLNRTTTTSYDATYHTFPTGVSYPSVTYTDIPGFSFSLTESREYYLSPATDVAPFGKLKSVTGVDGQTTKLEYDAFGRPSKLWKPSELNGLDPSVAYAYSAFGSLPSSPYRVTVTTRNDAGGRGWASSWYTTWQFYDGLGRPIQSQKEFTPGPVQVQSTRYDARGLPETITLPYAGSSPGTFAGFDASKPATQTSYDALGRVTSVRKPDDTTRTTTYLNTWGWTVVTDENGHQKSYNRDALGRLVLVCERNDSPDCAPDGQSYWTGYAYNVLDKLISVTDAQGSTTSMTYDKLGRKTEMWDPDMGHWRYSYDAVGNMVQTIDARNTTVVYDYDQLNRLRSKQYPDGSSAKYLYDGCLAGTPSSCLGDNRGGRLWAKASTDGSNWWASFDADGRTAVESWSVPDPNVPQYSVWHTYNGLDQEITTNYLDDGEIIQHTYQGGALAHSYSSQEPTGWMGLDVRYSYNAQGQTKTIDWNYGSLVSTYGYYGYNAAELGDSRDTPSGWGYTGFGKLWRMDATVAGSSVSSIQLGYDNAGNVNHLIVGDSGQSDDLYANYDALNRLIDLRAGSWTGSVLAQYSYDNLGDMLTKLEGGTTATFSQFGQVGAPHHAPASVSVDNGISTTATSLTYDASGNLHGETGGANHTLSYDSENRLISDVDHTASITTTFAYEPDGQRTRRTVQMSTGITTTYYAGKLREFVVDAQGPAEWSKFYWFNGQLLGQRTVSRVNGRVGLLRSGTADGVSQDTALAAASGADGWSVENAGSAGGAHPVVLAHWTREANGAPEPGADDSVSQDSPPGSITAPVNGATVTTSPLSIQFSGSNVSQVQFWVNYNGAWHDLGTDTNGADGWSVNWDWSPIVNQQVILSAWMWDTGNNLTIDAGGYVWVTLQGASRITSPGNGATLGSWPLTIQAWGNGISRMQFWVNYDGSWHDLGTDSYGADGWSVSWNWSAVANQTATLSVWMWDINNNLTTDAGGYVWINLQSPWRITAPGNGAGVTSWPLTLQAAGDGASRVQFWAYYDNVWHDLGTDWNGGDGWSLSWDWSSVVNQTVTLSIWMWDGAGNLRPDAGGYVWINLQSPWRITTPTSGTTVTSCPLSIQAWANAVTQVEFWVNYDGNWHDLGTDTDGADGWSGVWNCGNIRPQAVMLTTWMWGSNGSFITDPGGYVSITLNEPFGGISSPQSGTTVTSSPLPIQFTGTGVSKVQFFANYDGAWHDLGTDTNGADGWSVTWDWSPIANQAVILSTWMWDTNNTLTIDAGGYVYVTVQGTWHITTPAANATLTTCPTTLQAFANEASKVQFWANYNGGWHDLGTDITGADGWSVVWNCAGVPDQTVTLTTWMWDANDILTINAGGYITVTLNQPALSANVKLYWYVPDHLGGQHVMVDAATGAVVSTRKYWPYGETRAQTGSSPTDRRYTGQTLDTSTGLYYYGARYYSPALGRFVQADSIVPDPANPQTFNRFSYALNSPLTYADPTGHCANAEYSAAGCPSWMPDPAYKAIDTFMALTVAKTAHAPNEEGRTGDLEDTTNASDARWYQGAGLDMIPGYSAADTMNSCLDSGCNAIDVAGGMASLIPFEKVAGGIVTRVLPWSAFKGLSRAAEYGVKTYGTLSRELSHSGLRAHHLIEKRFASLVGKESDEMLSIALTPEEHQLFTNRWRKAIGYANDNVRTRTQNANRGNLRAAIEEVYGDHPQLKEIALQELEGK